MNLTSDPVESAFDSLVHQCMKIETTPEIIAGMFGAIGADGVRVARP